MKYKMYTFDCPDGTCLGEVKDTREREEEKCPRCGFAIEECQRQGKTRYGEIVKRFLADLEDTEKAVSGWKRDIRDRRDLIRIAGGQTVRIPDLEEPAEPVLAQIRKLRRLDFKLDLETSLAKTKELFDMAGPVFDFYGKINGALREMADKVFSEKRFQESKSYPVAGEATVREKVKIYPVSDGGGERKMSKMRIFKEGQWLEVEPEGQELADRIKRYMRENPVVSYEQAAVVCEKEMMAKGGTRNFYENAAGVVTGVNSGVPDDVVREFSEIPFKTGSLTFTADRRWCRVPTEQILPVDDSDAEAIRAFQDERNFLGGRYVGPKSPEKKFGYSRDGKTFTTRDGVTCQVDNDPSEAEAVERAGFVMQFADELKAVPTYSREEVIGKTIRLLKNAGIEHPMKADRDVVRYAVRASQGGSEVYDRALRYTSEGAVQAFGSTLKALVVATA